MSEANLNLQVDVEEVPAVLTGRPLWKATTVYNEKKYVAHDYSSFLRAALRLYCNVAVDVKK